MTIIAGTGHRPDKLESMPLVGWGGLKSFAQAYLQRGPRPRGIISGVALGWDLALALAALDLGIPLRAAVPFKGHDERWMSVERDLLTVVLGRATEVVVVCEGGYEPWKYQKRNEYMVDHCDEVLALWNGEREGGTWNTIAYADRVKKPVVNCWDAFERWLHGVASDGESRP